MAFVMAAAMAASVEMTVEITTDPKSSSSEDGKRASGSGLEVGVVVVGGVRMR